jgi:serine-threonine kinase receptor-associated protein
VSAAHDKLPQIRNGETGDWIGTFHGHKGAVWSMKVDKRTRTLAATASGDFTAKLWCATTGTELYEFKHKHVVKSVDFSDSSERIATGCQDGLMRIYDVCRPEAAPEEFRISPTGVEEAIVKVKWLEENILVLCKRSGVVEKWDVRTNSTQPIMSVNVPGGMNVMDLEVCPAHDLILVAAGKKVGP